MRVFGVDPGSLRTGYGCIDTDGSRHRLVACGAIAAPAAAAFPDKLLAIYRGLSQLLRTHRPDCVVVENVFHALNVRSALKLGHEFALTRKTRPELVMGKEVLLTPAKPHAIILED